MGFHQVRIPLSNMYAPGTLVRDFLEKNTSIEPFVGSWPSLAGLGQQISFRKEFSSATREIVQAHLKEQYANLPYRASVQQHIDYWVNPNCFTVTTGHQLNLFTGPLYVVYKLISTIKLAEKLTEEFPEHHFVPVYWMATEDHDFAEINHFYLGDQKLVWEPNTELDGPVGNLKTAGIDSVFDVLASLLGTAQRAEWLKSQFELAYLQSDNLAQATLKLADALFGDRGLVVIDADRPELKRLFKPLFVREFNQEVTRTKVNESIEQIKGVYPGYEPQVSPRDLNFFYVDRGRRGRMERDEQGAHVVGSDIKYTTVQWIELYDQFPERFSPNVLTRPLYQETILPNLAYIGGGGELSYWFELKNLFEAVEVPFPVLIHRDAAVLMTEKQWKKIAAFGLEPNQLFLSKDQLINKKIRSISNIELDLGFLKEQLEAQFAYLYTLAESTDPSFIGAVHAQKAKQMHGIDVLEKRLLNAQKRQLKDQVARLSEWLNELFPLGGYQERKRNFAPYYLSYGSLFFDALYETFDPLDQACSLIIFP
ncbi:MAG: bacillithiol biosynthesis cysteine-adding enzyme BshC [Flavobacteriaceae bacterium]